MGQQLRKNSDAAKRVRRTRKAFDRLIEAVDGMARDLERGRVPEDDIAKGARALLQVLPTLVTLECKLDDYDTEDRGGVPGREPPMDLAAARGEILGRLARLAEFG